MTEQTFNKLVSSIPFEGDFFYYWSNGKIINVYYTYEDAEDHLEAVIHEEETSESEFIAYVNTFLNN